MARINIIMRRHGVVRDSQAERKLILLEPPPQSNATRRQVNIILGEHA